MRHATRVIALVATIACSREVAVQTSFPAPVMEKVPATVGLHLTPALRTHVHEAKLPGDDAWNVALGPANVTFFEQLADGMFARVVPLTSPRAPSGVAVAAILQPAIVDYQVSTPDQSQTDYFEAWIRYRMHVFAPDGTASGGWTFTGYGRSEGAFLGSREALDEATQRAMRDAGAVAVLELPRQPALRAFLPEGAVGGR